MTLPLSVFTVLFNSTPFFTAILAYFYLKEALSLVEVFAMIGSFGGICLLGFGKPSEDDQQAETLANITQFGQMMSP